MTWSVLFHLLLCINSVNLSLSSPSSYPELDQLYLDPDPYLNVLSSNSSTDRSIKIRIQPKQHFEWLKQRDAAREHAHNGHLDRAKQEFQSIIMTKGALLAARVVAGLHLELGDVLLLLGDDNACHHHYLEAQAFLPTSHLPHARLAKLSTHLGHFDTAIEHYKHALFFNHSHLISLHNIGSLLFIQCKVEEAWHYFDVAIHGSDHIEDYRRISLTLITEDDNDVDETANESGGGIDGESRKNRIVRNRRRNIAGTNYHKSVWLVAHVMYVFKDKDKDRNDGFDKWEVVTKLKDVEQYSDFDRIMVLKFALNMLSYFYLHPMSLYEESMNIWTTLHALEDALSAKQTIVHKIHDITTTTLLSMTFLMQYANAVPQLLNSKNENDKAFVIEEIWERREWVKERFENARIKSSNSILNNKRMNTKEKMTILEMFSSAITSKFSLIIGHITSDPWAIRTLTSQITSSTLQVSSSSSISIAAEIQFVAQKLTSWTIARLPTLHRVQPLDDIWRPPSDPSHNMPFDRKLILRLAGKLRLRRKIARRKLRKKRKNNNIRVHEERRDERAFRAMKTNKRNRDEEKKKASTKTGTTETTAKKLLALDSDILPIIHVGFICESLDSYMHHIHSPVTRHILLLLQSTVQRYHVTIYIPEWAGNKNKREDIKSRYEHYILKQYKDDYAWMTRVSETTVPTHNIWGEHLKKLLTIKILKKNKKTTTSATTSAATSATTSATTENTYVSRIDVWYLLHQLWMTRHII